MMTCLADSDGDIPPTEIPANSVWYDLGLAKREPGAFQEPPPATADELNAWPDTGDKQNGAAT
jgi:hypothetical protein